MAESSIFQYLKPYCVQVAQEPTLKSMSELKDVLQLVAKDAFKEENMVKYVLFPLKLTIQRIKSTNEKLLLMTLECICLIFSFHNLVSEQLFLEVFDICCVLLSSKKQSVGKEMLADISEEVKMEIVRLMNNLLIRSNNHVSLLLYSKPILPRLGHAVSLILVLSEFEKDKDLRLESNRCLQHLALKHKDISEDESQIVSDTFCSFIPGITMSLSRILLDASNIGQNVFASVIDTLKDFILLVMADCRFSFLKEGRSNEDIALKLKTFSNVKQKTEQQVHSDTSEGKSIIINRDKIWMENTASNISVLIRRFATRAAYHSSPKVRLAIISFAESLLKECAISMNASVPDLIEVLAGMQHDEYDVIFSEARRAIECCRVAIEKGDRSLHATIEEKLYDKLLSLPRVMKSTNDDQKIIILNVLLGYFNLLGDRLTDVLNSISVLEKLLKSFIQALELDVRDVKIVEEKNPVSSEEMIDQNVLTSTDISYASHRFKNFKDMRIFQTIKKICYSIAKYAEFNIVVDYLLEIFLSSSVHRKETVLFLNELLRCRIEIEENSDFDIEKGPSIAVVVNQIISTFLRDDFWFLPTSNVNDVGGITQNLLDDQLTLLRTEEKIDQLSYWEKGIPIEQINSNIQLICLMINSISVCSGVRNFNVFLIKVMYPLLEKLGNENALIANSALSALSVISKNCEGTTKNCSHVRAVHGNYSGSIAELISSNADYLINSISMSFRHLTLLSSAPCVLSVMFSYSNSDILQLAADVIQDVFHCLDLYQEEVAFSLMKVLKSLALAVQTWFGSEPIDSDLGEKPVKEDWNKVVTGKELGCFITDYCRHKMEALGEVESDDEIAENAGNFEEKDPDLGQAEDAYHDEKKKIPVHFEVTLQALEKCKHFLPSKDTTMQLLTLDVTQSCVQALSQRRDDLLPVVHNIWPSLVGRLIDSQHVVLLRTIDVLNTMVECTSDFLAQRMKRDVYPFLHEYLEKHRATSQKGGPMYRFSPTCKVQTRILRLIGNVVQRLGLSHEDLWKIASACYGYLDCRQPLEIQIEASNVFNNLRNIDWSTTWLILTSLYSSEDLNVPNSCFDDVHLNKECFKRNAFTDNVKKILYHDNLRA